MPAPSTARRLEKHKWLPFDNYNIGHTSVECPKESIISLTARTALTLVLHIPHSPAPPTPIPIPSRRQMEAPSTQCPPLICTSFSPSGSNAWHRAPTVDELIPDPGRISIRGSWSFAMSSRSFNTFRELAEVTVMPWPLEESWNTTSAILNVSKPYLVRMRDTPCMLDSWCHAITDDQNELFKTGWFHLQFIALLVMSNALWKQTTVCI